jgi:hypothetical protein
MWGEARVGLRVEFIAGQRPASLRRLNRAFSAGRGLFAFNPGLSPWAGLNDAVGVSRMGLSIFESFGKQSEGPPIRGIYVLPRYLPFHRNFLRYGPRTRAKFDPPGTLNVGLRCSTLNSRA